MTQVALFLTGAGALAAGCWLIWPPVALIVLGTLTIAAAVGLERGSA